MASTSNDHQSPSTDTHTVSISPPHASHPPRSASMSSHEHASRSSSLSSHIQWRSEISQPTTISHSSTWRSQHSATPESIPKSDKVENPHSQSCTPSVATTIISVLGSSATPTSLDSNSPTIHSNTVLPSATASRSIPEASALPTASSEHQDLASGHLHATSAAANRPMAPLLFGDYSLPYSPTLYDLKHALSLDKSSKQQDFRQSLQLHTHLMGLSLSTRLFRGLDSAHEQAHEAFKHKQRPDQRHVFVSVFNQAYEEAERTLHRALAAPQPRPSFLDRLTQGSSKAVLDFLHLLRTEPKILARAFANLQAQELDHLTIPERPLSASQGATAASPTTASSAQKYGQATLSRGFSGTSAKPPSARERSNSLFLHGSLGSQSSVFGSAKNSHGSSSFTQGRSQTAAQGGSTVSGLGSDSTIVNFMNNQDVVHIILENLFGPPSFEGETQLQRNLVATIVAELLVERKGERLIGEFLERYLRLADWQHFNRSKAKLEATILGIIHRGDSALNGYSDQELSTEMAVNQLPVTKASLATVSAQGGSGDSMAAFRMDESLSHRIGEPVVRRENLPPTLPRLTTRQSKVEGFFTEACLEILDCLQECFPPNLLLLIRAIFSRIDDDKRAYATLVIVIKFVFYRFMNKCIAYPETYGLMQDNFITERQRQRTLFTTHQRLYRSVTMIVNPLPGWEKRAAWLDSRLREAVENFVDFLITPSAAPTPQQPMGLTPRTDSILPKPPGPPPISPDSDAADTKSPPTVTPVLMLCPSDVTTLFFFVAPKLRTPVAVQMSQSIGSPSMTRSNSLGSGKPYRHRTTSETPPLATRAAVNAASVNHPTEIPPNPRVHKRSSASFSFFGSSAFKSKPPPPSTVERSKNSTAGDVNSGLSFSSTGHHGAGPSPTLSAVRTSSTVQPQMATIEVTTTTRVDLHPETGIATCPTTRATEVQTPSPRESTVLKAGEDVLPEEPVRSASPVQMVTPAEDWADEELLPAMKTAIQEIKAVYPGPIKEVPWSFLKASFDPLQEPWALVYVQYPSFQMFQSSQHDAEGKDSSSADADQYPAPSGLALAPPCMAMVMENSAFGAKPRSVTVTTPVLVDQGMDSAGNPQSGLSEGLVVDLDLDVDASDTDSILMPEDGSSNSIASSISLGIASRQTHDDHHGQLDWLGSRGSRTGHDTLRSNSSQMLSALSSSSSLHPSHSHPRPPVSNGSMRWQRESSPMTSQRSREFEHQWKQKMRQRIRSEYDLPEDVRTVAKAVFRVLREFDIVPMDTAWIYPGRTPYKEEMSIRSLLIRAIEQARLYGSHAAAVSIHHALSVLNSSSILQVLDDAKLVFLLSLPIYHRLQHRSDRMRARILWEAHAHSWHQRVLAAIERRREDLSSLRIKMYYQTCVRPSKAFERSWAVVQVLSKLNHETLQKYMTAEEVELERQHAVEMQKQNSGHVYLPQGNEFDDDDSLDMQDSTDRHTAVCDPHSLDGLTCESPTVRRRDSPSKSRRSSFSTYIDNMAARSYNSQISFLESQMREREKERDRENDKVKKLSSSYTPSQHGSHLLNQYYHVQEPQPPPTPSGTSRQQPLHRAGSRQSLGNHIVGSGPRGWPVMFDKDASSSASNTSHSPTPPATDFVMDAREASAAKKWIQDTGINDFLPGEDNFHRFCMEVELVVRGVGLGGTGIQDAGIPQAIQGQPSATLHSSGSDFFVKEVLRFNGAFVPGLGPPPELLMSLTGSGSGGLSSSSSTSTMSSAPPTPTVSSFATSKSSTAAGVAEYLVNSLKGSSSQSGSQNSGSPISGLTTSLQSGGNFGLGSSGNSSKSRLRIRKVAPTLQISSEDRNISLLDDNLPSLGEDDDSIFATPNPGPTYLLYNPPFASATAGPSSSYSSSTTPGNMSLVSLPHQAGQPIKDLDDLLLKIQLKLTSYVLSEWLDVFGGVETDRWFAEFMEDMMLSKSEGESRSKDDDHPPPLSVSSASSRGITPSSSQQEHLKPMSHSNSSINTSLSDVDTTTSSTNRRKVVTRGRSPLMADGHADGTSGRSPSIGTASRTSSSLSNVSAEGCFTISDIDVVHPSCSEGGHANGKFAKIPDTIAASTTQFSTASSVRPGVPNDNMTHRTSRAEMTQSFGPSAQFEPDSNRTRTTPTPSSMQQQQRPPNSGRSVGSHSTEHETERLGAYDVEEAIKSTVMQMEQIKSPFQKLVHLFSLELLVVASLSYPASCSSGGTNSTSLDSAFTNSIFDSVHSLSSLASEGDADDSDRHSYQHRSSRRKRHGSPVPKSYTPGTDAIVNAIEKLFRKPWPFRPRNLFRDMQLIATFIPGSILDLRDDGKAFWDMALAVTSLKKEVVEHLVKRGLELVETEEVAVAKDHGGLGVSGHTHGYYRNDEEERLRMREAVRLFTIGAKESHSVAQRELAILYMSLPAIPSNTSRTARYTCAPGGRLQYHLRQQRVQQQHLHHLSAKSTSPSSISTFRFLGTGGGGGSSTPSSPKSPSTATMVPGTATTALSSSIPIMRSGSDDKSSSRSRRHRHSSSNGGGIGGAASSFTGNVLNGLGIMAGLGSFTSGGGSGRDGNTSGGTGGGDPSSATSNVGSATGSYGSSNGGTGVSTTAAAPVLSQAMEDLNHLHLASGARSGPRPCSCGSEGSSFGRQLMSHFTDGAGGSSCPCHYHHQHHRHTSSTSSNSSVGSFERDRAGHGRHYHPQHHGQPLDSSSSSSLTGLDKFNPENVAAAMHWFTLAAAQGDKFSIEYLRHRDMASGMLK